MTAEDIYSKLGDSTVSKNVTLKNVFQKAGQTYAKENNAIFSLRVSGTDLHFGNPFSSIPAEISKGSIKTESTKESVLKYIEWILLEDTDIKPLQHAYIKKELASGRLKNKSIIYYKELKEPSHATALDYLINQYEDVEGEIDPNAPIPETKDISNLFDRLNSPLIKIKC